MPTLLNKETKCPYCGAYSAWIGPCWNCRASSMRWEPRPAPVHADNQPLAPRRKPANGREQLLNEMAEAKRKAP